MVRRGAFARGTPSDMSRKGVLIVVNLWGCNLVIDRQTDKFYCYRPKRSFGQGYVFTGVCDSVHGGGCLLQIFGGLSAPNFWGVACSKFSGGGVCSKFWGGVCSKFPGGCLLQIFGGVVCSKFSVGGSPWGVWPSVMAFWFGGLLAESGFLVWWLSS